MQTINIFISKTVIKGDDCATADQIKYLKKLCYNQDVDFPFNSMQQTKAHLKKYEASRAIKELLAGNTIEFIYPITLE